jgi:hypothetical protein
MKGILLALQAPISTRGFNFNLILSEVDLVPMWRHENTISLLGLGNFIFVGLHSSAVCFSPNRSFDRLCAGDTLQNW